MRNLLSLAVDAVAVILFALVGRASHSSGLTLAGIAQTAWPFLVAVVVGWLLAARFGGDSWWRSGLIVWAVTVVLGIGLRLLGGETAQGGFVVVTTVVLGVLLIGWRFVAAVSRRRPQPTT